MVGGAGSPGPNNFDRGFQMNIYRLTGDPSEFEGSSPTKYPNIIKDRPCDGAGCTDDTYYFLNSEGVGIYGITMYKTDPSYSKYVDMILSSMKLVK